MNRISNEVIFTTILIIVMNLIIGIMQTISLTLEPEEIMTRTIQEMENMTENKNEFYTEDGIKGVTTAENQYLTQPTIGNEVNSWRLILNTIGNGLIPWSIHPDHYNDVIQKTIAGGLIMFRTIIDLIGIIMWALIIFAKKTT